ncbi:MAG: hypothetical protein KGL53_12720 [Elusimicrobia bacterium]|nr:hypothetical protein [Elusimicrobiota bacterium]
MLLSGLMAAHVGAFAGWLAAQTADAALESRGAAPLRRGWAPACMLVCLGAGALSMRLSYPYYSGQEWLWAKVWLASAAAAATLLRAAGRLSARRALAAMAVPALLALVLAFTRPF